MEMREALRVRLEESTQFQRIKGLAEIHVQTLGEHSLAAWMTRADRAARSSADAPPVLPPEATPAAGSSPAAPISESQAP
eukprot:9243635-Pyramimonas_sp.AAC.2